MTVMAPHQKKTAGSYSAYRKSSSHVLRALNLIYISRSRLHRNRANLIQTLHTVEAFQRIGLQVRLYLPPWHRGLNFSERLEELGIHSNLEVRPSQFLHSRWRRFGFWPFIHIYRSRLRKADAIYVRSPEISSALVSAGLVHHLEIHETEILLKGGLLGQIVKHHRLGIIDWLVPINQVSAGDLIDAGAVPARIHVSPSGVDLEAFEQIDPFSATHLDHPRVVYVGRISNDRGLGVFQALAERGIGEVTLVGKQDDPITASSLLRVEPFIPHRDIAKWYGQADLVLLPYQRGLRHVDSISPMKLFEALAAGRPIIASDIPPIREILEHKKTGLLVEPGNIDAWVEAIDMLRQEPALALRIAQAAKSLASHFTWYKRAEGIARAFGWDLDPGLGGGADTHEGRRVSSKTP
jgi:glycosyltransferase involved in cell wall biosynthesis